MTVKQWQQHWMNALSAIYPNEESRSLLIMVLSTRFGWEAVDLVIQQKTELVDVDQKWLNQVLSRLLNNEPIQYVLGCVRFFGHEFKVSKGALIPRPETEQLVRLMLDLEREKKPKKALDIGTGSGCIALSAAASMKETQWQAWDISKEALTLAKENQTSIGAEVQWQVQDVFKPWPNQSFDLVVSNPPYIPLSEKPLMHNNVRQHEPHGALFVSDEYPINYYERIADQGRHHLNPGGRLYFECHYRYADQVHQMLETLAYTQVITREDEWGKPRFVLGVRPEN